MKTLAQIEPRTPISAVPFSIAAPGSYYFTTNLIGPLGTNGITIQTDNVTVDLNGFSLLGSKGAQKGIWVSGPRRNITVRNGTVSNWAVGIQAEQAFFCRLEFLAVSDNGGNGFVAGANSVIVNSTSASNEGAGITADRESVIRDCVVRGNILSGIQAGSGSQVMGCTVSFNNENGMVVEKNCLVANCNVLNNVRAGIVAGEACQINGASAASNRETGIAVSTNSVVNNCFATLNGVSGITGSDNCQITSSTASYNGQNGILLGGEGNISNCTASYNQENGMVAGASSQILESKALNNKKAGIRVETGSTVRACTAQRNSGDGIVVNSECTVAANSCNNNFNARDSAGIHATGTDNCLKENTVVSNDRGVSVDVGGNLILKNTAANNTINYFIIGSQTMGPIFKGPAPIDVNNPWTNFEF